MIKHASLTLAEDLFAVMAELEKFYAVALRTGILGKPEIGCYPVVTGTETLSLPFKDITELTWLVFSFSHAKRKAWVAPMEITLPAEQAGTKRTPTHFTLCLADKPELTDNTASRSIPKRPRFPNEEGELPYYYQIEMTIDGYRHAAMLIFNYLVYANRGPTAESTRK